MNDNPRLFNLLGSIGTIVVVIIGLGLIEDTTENLVKNSLYALTAIISFLSSINIYAILISTKARQINTSPDSIKHQNRLPIFKPKHRISKPKPFQGDKVFFSAQVILAILLCFSVQLTSIIARPESIETNYTTTPTYNFITQQPEISNTDTETLSPTTNATIIYSDIIVGDWKINRIKCVNKTRPWVALLGVEISGGLEPYRITISQKGDLLYEEIIVTTMENHNLKVIFNTPVIVKTGLFVDVTIS